MTGPNVNQRDQAARQSPGGITLPLPSPLLAMLPPMLQGYPMAWFIEPITILSVAPGASETEQFTTDSTHVHVSWWGSLKVRSADNQTDRDADPSSYQMTDTQTLGYQPPGASIDTALVWGNAKQPAVWPVPLIVKQNNGIILTVTNEHAANTNNYFFAFVGVLIKVPATLEF